MTTSFILRSDDSCRLRAHYSLRWEVPTVTPYEILRRAVESGLRAESEDWAKHASDMAMKIACENTIDTSETDLLSMAKHIAALAGMIVWILRPENAPWESPEPVQIGNHTWEPSCFYGANESELRQIVIVDRINELKELEIRNSWDVRGESAIYNLPISVIVVIVGQLRNGKWKSPLTFGYRHPKAKDLRFRKRDDSQFADNWTRVFRELDDSTTEEWYDAILRDGVLTECFTVLPVECPTDAVRIVELAESKLDRIYDSAEIPEPQPSQCFQRINPCPYRHCCAEGPSEAAGFTKLPCAVPESDSLHRLPRRESHVAAR